MTKAGPDWAPRLKKKDIARLYATDALGIHDQALIEEVGIGLLARCESILAATEAWGGRAPCPACEAIIEHTADKESVLRCAQCGWQGSWRAYQATYRRRQLVAGSMASYIRDYVERYPRARSLGEKMVLIDTLIHHYHGEIMDHPCRPGALNLIEGRMDDIVAFLDGLSRGGQSTAGVVERGERWKQLEERSRAVMRPDGRGST